MWVPKEELLRASAASSSDLIPAGFGTQKLWGLLFLSLESLAGGLVCFGSGSPRSCDIPPEFLSMWVWGQPVLCLRPLIPVWRDVVTLIL